MGNYDNAISCSNDAIKGYAEIGEINGLKTAREVLIGAYEKSNRHEDALRILEEIANDPLGEQGDFHVKA